MGKQFITEMPPKKMICFYNHELYQRLDTLHRTEIGFMLGKFNIRNTHMKNSKSFSSFLIGKTR